LPQHFERMLTHLRFLLYGPAGFGFGLFLLGYTLQDSRDLLQQLAYIVCHLHASVGIPASCTADRCKESSQVWSAQRDTPGSENARLCTLEGCREPAFLAPFQGALR
jgi:hypothetical protein